MLKITSLFESLVKRDNVALIPVKELISDDPEVLEKELQDLGAKLACTNNLHIAKKSQVTIGDRISDDIFTINEITITVLGMDNLPVYILIKHIEDVCMYITADRKIAVILWSGGGSTNIDGRFFLPLKKYWLLSKNAACVISLYEDQEKILEEMSKIENFSNLYKRFEIIQKTIDTAIKNQDFNDAVEARKNSIPLLEELEHTFNEKLTSIVKERFIENFLKTEIIK